MEGKQLGELLLDDLRVVEDYAHVGLEYIHILAHGDPMLLGLILKSMEPRSEVLNLVLEGRRRTGDIWLSRRLGGGEVDGRWMGGRSHPGSPHACQTRSGMGSTPHPKAHDLSHKQRQIEERPAYPFLLRWP